MELARRWWGGAKTCLDGGQEAQSAIGQSHRVKLSHLVRADILGSVSPASPVSSTQFLRP